MLSRVFGSIALLLSPLGGGLVGQERNGTTAYAVEPGTSQLVVIAHKSGLFSFLAGHEHGVIPTTWSGRVCVDTTDLTRSSLAITVPAESLVIDTPEARGLAGLDPQGGPGTEDRAKIQRKMLGPEVLDAQRHPEIRFRSTDVAISVEDSTRLRVTGTLELHGQVDTVVVPFRLARPAGERLRSSGSFQFKQTRFGIQPESVAGLVNVKDEMTVRFDLVARRTGGGC